MQKLRHPHTISYDKNLLLTCRNLGTLLHQHFLLFPQCFQKLTLKVGINYVVLNLENKPIILFEINVTAAYINMKKYTVRGKQLQDFTVM